MLCFGRVQKIYLVRFTILSFFLSSYTPINMTFFTFHFQCWNIELNQPVFSNISVHSYLIVVDNAHSF